MIQLIANRRDVYDYNGMLAAIVPEHSHGEPERKRIQPIGLAGTTGAD